MIAAPRPVGPVWPSSRRPRQRQCLPQQRVASSPTPILLRDEPDYDLAVEQALDDGHLERTSPPPAAAGEQHQQQQDQQQQEEGEGQAASSSAAEGHLVVDGMAIGAPSALAHAFRRFLHWWHGHYLLQLCAGLEHLPLSRGAFVIASNHCSHLDCSALYFAADLGGVERLYALGARDYFFSKPAVRWFVTSLMGVIPFSRTRFSERDASSLLAVKALASLERPAAVVVFPEGTRSLGGGSPSLGRFKGGAGYLAGKAGLPVVPAYVNGTAAALPKNSFMPRRRRVAVRFGPPVEPPAELLQHPQQQQASGGLLAAEAAGAAAAAATLVAAASPAAAGGARTPAGAPVAAADGGNGAGSAAVGATDETRDKSHREARKAALDAFAEQLRDAVLLLKAETEASRLQRHPQQQQSQQPLRQEQQQQAKAGAAARGSPLQEGRSMPRFAGDFLPRWLSGMVAALLATAFSALRWLELAAWAAAAALRGGGSGRGKRRV